MSGNRNLKRLTSLKKGGTTAGMDERGWLVTMRRYVIRQVRLKMGKDCILVFSGVRKEAHSRVAIL
jgi:hypothetical protein